MPFSTGPALNINKSSGPAQGGSVEGEGGYKGVYMPGYTCIKHAYFSIEKRHCSFTIRVGPLYACIHICTVIHQHRELAVRTMVKSPGDTYNAWLSEQSRPTQIDTSMFLCACTSFYF